MKRIALLLYCLTMPQATWIGNAIADEVQTEHNLDESKNMIDLSPVSISPVQDVVKPESKASVAQENALKKNTYSILKLDDKPKREADLIDGLILNRAMTRLGHRFYREFVSAYRDINGMSDHSGLTVVEQATARNGSRVLVQHNRKTIFVTFVSPASRNIDAQANVAAKRVNASLLQNKQQSKWNAFSDPDLAPDEF